MAQYHVNLAFSADTSKAKAQLQDLQKQLTNLISAPTQQLGLEADITKAAKAAAELKSHLQAATNVKTGSLDFAKLNESLRKNNTNLKEYANTLRALGPEGQKAFLSLAQAVAQSEIPIRRSTEAVDALWQTLKNTARWQISSSILHGFMGAIQTAYGYAQDLNSSLNDIRIVTGQNTEQMAKFAKEANAAAKQLSATTTQYTKASLIYYQQGLSDQEVKERTDITVKMANVARSSAEDVSDQLTAVWNNFYDGSKSLEHYADVMTALGAATASSTDEISEGLNKFAAVAETVGLSYEYAASALATVTATTRESADVVGNAFKTLFARIQGLKLGETLDDGTTLNKYSQALDAVGIKIQGVNGEIKDMDTILNELGAKWDTLGKDQQIALAQTVAGVRQYTQLIALMDNWDYFQENLSVANTSAGALQEQADIYAESWEAAQDRVTAAAESIYEKLLDDDFFIDLLNAFEDILGYIDNLIDGLGGLKGVLLTLGSILTKVFNTQLSQTMTNMVYSIRMSTTAGREAEQKKRKETLDELIGEIPESVDYTSDSETARMSTMRQTLEAQNALTEKASRMSQIELETNQFLLDRVKILADANVEAAKSVEEAQKMRAATIENAQNEIVNNFVAENKDPSLSAIDGTAAVRGKLAQRQEDLVALSQMETALLKVKQQGKLTAEEITSITSSFGRFKTTIQGTKLQPIIQSLKAVDAESEDWQDTIDNLQIALNILYGETNKRLVAPKGIGLSKETAQQMINDAHRVAEANLQASNTNERFNRQIEATNKSIQASTGAQAGWADGMVACAGTIMSVVSALQQVKGLIDVWKNDDMSFGEKLLTTFSTLAMVVPLLIHSFSMLNLQQMAGFAAAIQHAIGIKTETVAMKMATGATYSFGTALYSVLWPIGLLILAITAVVGIIALVSRAFESEASATEKAAQAVADQEKAVARLNERLEETRSELESVKSLLEEYQKLDDAFDGLVEGSVEWLDNLQQQNTVIKELLDKYPELIEMGAIGFKNGVYQILDPELTKQYAQGKATVDMLSAELGVTGANYTLAIAQAELDALEKRSKLLSYKANHTTWKTEDTAVSALNGNQFTVDSTLNGKAFNATVNDEILSAAAHKKGTDYIEATVHHFIETAAMEVSSAMYNGVETAEEAVAAILQKDLDEHAGEYYRYEYEGAKQLLEEVADHLYYAESDYLQQLEEIQAEELRVRTKLLQQFEVKWQMQAQSILSNQKNYLGLDALQRQAATILTANELQANAKKYDYGVIGYRNDLSVEFVKNLAAGLHYDDSNDYGKWEDYFGNEQDNKGDIYNDAGDFFNKTEFGHYLMDTYLAEVRGIAGGLKSFEGEDGFKRDSYKVTYGDGEEVTYAEVLDYFTSAVEYNAVNYDKIMSQVQKYSDATLAALTNNIDELSENELLRSQLATKDSYGNYKLNTNSTAYREALKLAGYDVYDATKTDLTQEEWAVMRQSWINELTNSIETYDAALVKTKKLQAAVAEGNALIHQAAKTYDLDAEAVQNYAQSLYSLYESADIAYTTIAKMAIANARLSKGLESLRKSWSNAAAALATYGKDSFEYFESIAEIQSALTDIFGVTVSAKFIEDNKEQINKLVAGGEEAIAIFQELELAAAKDYVTTLQIDGSYKSQFKKMLEEIDALEQDTTFGVGFTGTIDESYVNSLNELLRTSALTKEQVEAMFNSIGWDPNITYEDIPTTSESLSQIFTGSHEDVLAGKGGTWERIITHSTMQVPKIGDNSKITAVPKAPSSVSSITSSGGGKNKDDCYHYVSKSLQDAEREFDAVARARERAFGADKLALYDTEISKLDAVKQKLADYAEEAHKYYLDDKDALLKAPYGIVLDENGNISNYDEVFATFGQDEKFQELVSNYEDSLTTWKEKLQEVIDKNNELLDLSLEKIQYKIDLAVKIDDQNQAYFDFLMEMADDPLTNAAEKLGYLTDKMNSSAEVAKRMGESLREALRATGWNEADIDSILIGKNIKELLESNKLEELLASNKLTETQIEMIEQYRDQLYTTTQMLMTWADDIKDTVIEAFDEMGKAYDESANKLEHYNKILTTYENIIGLVGKDTLGISDSVFGELTQTQVDNAISLLRVHKEAYETDKAALEELRAADQTDWTDEAKEAWNEAVKHAEEKVRESEATMFDSWESALQAAADAFEKAVETAVKAYEKAMSGIYGSFDAMQTAYERQTTLNERYLEDYEKIYELSKLNRQVANSIDDTDNVKSKKILKELQDEILELSESEAEVSEYQISHLQKEYELKMALIALEEAQNAKSQVRMQRDSEGNWSYVYTADEAKVDNAQQNYEDKLFALQEYTQEYIQTNSDALMQLQQEYADAMANIKRENYATQEEYEAALAETTAFYESMMNYHLGEIGLATTDAQKLYEEDWAKYSEMTGYKLGIDKQWIDSWNKTPVALTTGLGSITQYQEAFKASSEKMITDLSGAYGTWSDNVGTAMDAAGTATDDFAGKVETDTEAVQGYSEKLVQYLDDIGKAAREAFKKVSDEAARNYSTYSKTVADYITENQKLIASLNEVIKKKAEVANQNTTNVTGNNTGDLSDKGNTGGPPVNNPSGQDNTSDLGEQDNTPTMADPIDLDPYFYSVQEKKVTGRSYAYAAIPYTSVTSSGWGVVGEYLVEKTTNPTSNRAVLIEDYIKAAGVTLETLFKQFKLYNAMGFDTGGYTGSWGSNGRLAVLHQKELVLNADDTRNMLQAVEIVRKIVRVIDLNAANAANAFGMLTATTAMTNDQIIEQEVTIHAEFPNATNHTEIEEAFNSLINRASQFANRKK